MLGLLAAALVTTLTQRLAVTIITTTTSGLLGLLPSHMLSACLQAGHYWRLEPLTSTAIDYQPVSLSACQSVTGFSLQRTTRN